MSSETFRDQPGVVMVSYGFWGVFLESILRRIKLLAVSHFIGRRCEVQSKVNHGVKFINEAFGVHLP